VITKKIIGRNLPFTFPMRDHVPMRMWFKFRVLVVALLALLLGSTWGHGKSRQRVVAIGDLHADISITREAFRLAGGTDENDNWIGGDLVIVQMGDLIGRGFEEREVLDFIFEVGNKASAAGGKVHVLIGNHEVFAARLVYDWVDKKAFAAYEGIPGLELDDPYLKHLPAAHRPRGAALMPGGHYAKKLAQFPAILQLGNTIFVHGSITPIWASYGIERINDEVSNWLAGHTSEPESSTGRDPGRLDDRVMWSRQFSHEVGEEDCRLLEESLSILGAHRMIVAHTVHELITARCNEQVWAVDVGMSRYYGGEIQLLEIIDDEDLASIKP